MKLFKKKEPKIMKLQKIKATFKTIDGIEHTGCDYKWINASGLSCTSSEYIMYDIKRDGYIYDDNDVMFILANVICIKWNIINEKKIVKEHEYHKIYFNDEEVKNMKGPY